MSVRWASPVHTLESCPLLHKILPYTLYPVTRTRIIVVLEGSFIPIFVRIWYLWCTVPAVRVGVGGHLTAYVPVVGEREGADLGGYGGRAVRVERCPEKVAAVLRAPLGREPALGCARCERDGRLVLNLSRRRYLAYTILVNTKAYYV